MLCPAHGWLGKRASGPSMINLKEVRMPRSVLVGIVAIGVMTGAALAQGKMDCNAMYKGFWDKFNATKHASVSAEELANVQRIALRFYDACQAGDEFNARAFFDNLSRNIN